MSPFQAVRILSSRCGRTRPRAGSEQRGFACSQAGANLFHGAAELLRGFFHGGAW